MDEKIWEFAKIQHNTFPFHSKKRHSTSCLKTCKVCLSVFLDAIVSFHCLVLIWIHLLLCLLLLLCWAMVKSSQEPSASEKCFIYVHFVPFIFFSLNDVSFAYYTRDYSTNVYLTITDSNWFSMCQDNSLFDVFIGSNVNH
jgi:hypothetical protein